MLKISVVRLKTALLFFLLLQVGSGSAAGIWRDIVPAQPAGKGNNAEPVYYRALRADTGALKQALAAAPLEFTSSQGAELSLPMPDGSMQRFEVESSPIMAPELAARYPQIQTYRVMGIDDPGISGRLDLTPKGFHAMLSTSGGTLFIDPDESGNYRSFTKQAYVQAKGLAEGQTGPNCLVEAEPEVAAHPVGEVALRSGEQRRDYRLAVAATGEYTQFHGGTVSGALDAITTAINRVNQVYERDVAIRFVLIANNDEIIYTNQDTDPYTNDNGVAMLAENQANLDTVIGPANYDIGHVFSTGGGGIAGVGVTCRAGVKAQGVTGRPDPVNDLFYIDLVAHELGHQMDASHTFNGTTLNCAGINRVASSAVEPGSGSTIMSYAGICGTENLQQRSDDSFHAKSIDQILDYSAAGGSCGVTSVTGNNPPAVSAGVDRTIPLCTPFELTAASASDVDGDSLSFQWDEMDIGTATDATTLGTDLGDNPLFRSFIPDASTSERIFPRMSALAIGTTDKGETLPAAARTMNFRLTARDGNGGVNEDDVRVTVDGNMGPFHVHDVDTSDGGVLNDGGPFQAVSSQTIEWSVGNTDTACTQVLISLLAFSPNGTTYCDGSELINSALRLGTFNNTGIATVLLPNLNISKGRVKVACANNIFFSLSAADIQINGTTSVGTDCKETNLRLTDGSGDLVEACRAQIGDVPSSSLTDSSGGGGGLLYFLSMILGFGLAWRTIRRTQQQPSI